QLGRRGDNQSSIVVDSALSLHGLQLRLPCERRGRSLSDLGWSYRGSHDHHCERQLERRLDCAAGGIASVILVCDPDANANPDADANADANSYANAHSDANPNPDPSANPNPGAEWYDLLRGLRSERQQ